MVKLTEQKYNKLPEELREGIAQTMRPHWGMFYDNEWWKDLEEIEYTVFKSIVFRWLAGDELW